MIGLTKEILYRAYATSPGRSVVRVFAKKVRKSTRAAILNFHQFYSDSDEILPKGPSVHTRVDVLEKTLKLLAGRYEFITLSDLVSRLKSGRPLDSDCISVTIDDGYRNNLVYAAPVFFANHVPVTLYVATGFIGTNKLLPMEALSYIVSKTRKKVLDGNNLVPAAIQLDGFENKRAAVTRLSSLLKQLSAEDMDRALVEIADLLDVDSGSAPRTMLSWDELRQLASDGFEIGSHAESHNILTRLPQESAIRELAVSKERIEAQLGKTVRHFAVPNGQDEDFSVDLERAALRIGYESIAYVTRGLCIPGVTPPARLRRIGLIGTPEETVFYIERLMWRSKEAVGTRMDLR